MLAKSNSAMGPITSEEIDVLVRVAAEHAGYPEGFGVPGCDLAHSLWWAAYIRQSREEQAQNNRIPEYLLTAARMAKENGLVVPREYILIDHESSEYLDRKYMRHLREELISKRRIAGVIFTHQGRLSADPLHQMYFERECSYYRVKFLFGDAPSGTDWASVAGRQLMAQANWLRVTTTREGARAGNIGRILKGMVPAHKAPFGYRYRRDAEITQNGKLRIKNAWWEIDQLTSEGTVLSGSPAWVVGQIFSWIGDEQRSLYWVASKLNEIGIGAPNGNNWSPTRVANILHHRSYTGNHAYNVNSRVPNPARPMGEITAQVKRTLLEPKPEEDWVHYNVPSFITAEAWERANTAITNKGRGRGKQGKSIEALLRNRMSCPRCGNPMIVRRNGHQNRVYYHCSKYFRPWAQSPCDYRRFVPGTWDDLVWGDVCTLLRDDSWLEQQVSSDQSVANIDKLIRIQESKIAQGRAAIVKVQEGYEANIYSTEEARERLVRLRASITNAEDEIRRLRKQYESNPGSTDKEALKEQLKGLRDRNLDEASFGERLDLISRLGIGVYPSEDLRSMMVVCQLVLPQLKTAQVTSESNKGESYARGECGDTLECAIVPFAPPSFRHDIRPLGSFRGLENAGC